MFRNETKKVEGAIDKLNEELQALDKNNIQETIQDKQNLIELLESLMENDTIQKRYPKYNKMKKFLYILPTILVAFITVGLIIASLVVGNITFTTFLPFLIWATDYVAYHGSTMVCDRKIQEKEMFKLLQKELPGKGLDEDLKLLVDISEYKPWAGAVDLWNEIVDADKVEELEFALEDLYPDGLTITDLNDLLWFEQDFVREQIGLAKSAEDDDTVEESFEEKRQRIKESFDK